MASAVEIHRAAHEAFTRRDWERMRALAAPDVRYTDRARGLTTEGVSDVLARARDWTTAMSDARVDDARYLDAGTHSVCRFQARGVNDGPLGRADATGSALDLPCCEVVRVEHGRIVEAELYYDDATAMAQLGVLQAPAAA